MQRDKLYGFLILLVSAALLVYLTLADWAWLICMPVATPKLPAGAFAPLGIPFKFLIDSGIIFGWEWYVFFPLWLVTVLIFGIAMWIGYTMLTTPPPVPLEELEELGLDDEEEGTA